MLTAAADGAKSLIDASDRLILYVEIARLFGALGYHRKAAFFSRQVAQLYLQQDNKFAAISAMQVLAMTTKAYRVQSRASIEHNISNVSLKTFLYLHIYNCAEFAFGIFRTIWYYYDGLIQP